MFDYLAHPYCILASGLARISLVAEKSRIA